MSQESLFQGFILDSSADEASPSKQLEHVVVGHDSVDSVKSILERIADDIHGSSSTAGSFRLA